MSEAHHTEQLSYDTTPQYTTTNKPLTAPVTNTADRDRIVELEKQVNEGEVEKKLLRTMMEERSREITLLEKQAMSLQTQKATEVEILKREIERLKESLEEQRVEYEGRLQTEVDTVVVENVRLKLFMHYV